MSFMFKYAISYIMDILIGDPEYLYHPVRFIGKIISFLESKFYKYKSKKFFGGLLVLITLMIVFVLSYFLARFRIIEIYLLFTTLATKSLGDEGLRVYNILKKGDIIEAREKLSYLVSRDTNEMNESQITRSVIETISENTVDGVIAPMFFAYIGSLFEINGISLALPFAMTYKGINTIDSMIGYKNDRYMDFGMIGAKLDDVANFIPARMSVIPIVIGSFILKYDYKRSFNIYFRDRLNHSSPNSGHSESCFAGALGLQFGGKTTYFGKVHDKPTIGDKLKEFSLEDILKARKLLYMSSLISFILIIII